MAKSITIEDSEEEVCELSNSLSRNELKLSINGQRLLYYIFDNLDENQGSCVKFKLSHVFRKLGIQHLTEKYKIIQNATSNIVSTPIASIRNNGWTIVPWFSAEIDEKHLSIEFSEHLLDFIPFFKDRIENRIAMVEPLYSRNGRLIYLAIKSVINDDHQVINKVRISIEVLKDLLLCSSAEFEGDKKFFRDAVGLEYKYSRWQYSERRNNPYGALFEINENSEIKIEASPIKTNGKYSHIDFIVAHKACIYSPYDLLKDEEIKFKEYCFGTTLQNQDENTDINLTSSIKKISGTTYYVHNIVELNKYLKKHTLK